MLFKCSMQLIHLPLCIFIHFDSVGSTGAFNFSLDGSPTTVLVLEFCPPKGIFPTISATMSLIICHMSSLISFKSSCLKDSKSKLEGPANLLPCEVNYYLIGSLILVDQSLLICSQTKRGLWLKKMYLLLLFF